MRARLVSLLAAMVLGGVLPACGKKKLTEVQVPDDGVELRYDLTPGQTYAGHVKLRNAITTPAGDIVARFEFDVDLLVTGTRNADGPLVTATVKSIDADAQVPDGVPIEAAGVSKEVAKQLEGVAISFNIDEQGKASNVPEPPKGASMLMQAMLGQLTGGILFGLVRVPETSLKKGQTWTPKPSREEPQMKVDGEGTFEGMVRDDASGLSLAKLSLQSHSEGTREAQGTTMQISSTQQVEVLFAPELGFPTKVKRNLRSTLGQAGTLVGETEVTWTKGEKREVTSAPPTEVQEITDPCDPDYVGPEECKDGSEEQHITDPCDPDYVGAEECKDPPTGN